MARSINEIQNNMLVFIAGSQTLAGMNSTSSTALYRLFTYVVAVAINLLEQLTDQHKKEIDKAISEQKSGTPNWYKNKSLSFQYGFDLLTDSDFFDNSSATQEEIEASKIVKYCSVKESIDSNRLIVKIASELNNVLEPLTEQEMESFSAYIEEIKYAGVKINVVNNPADKLILDMIIFRDPLVINDTGYSILNGNKPVEERISLYMKELPFNGELVLNDLIGQLRAVPGVVNVHINSASSSSFGIDDYTEFTNFTIKRIPEAGYYKLENFNNIVYNVA